MPILTPKERLGTRIAGKYELTEIIGEGGMGVVFGGKHVWTGRDVAVKVLLHQYTKDPEIVKRFLQEARTATKIEHPNVVDVLDMGHNGDGEVYLVLERLYGRPLSSLTEAGPLPLKEAAGFLLPIVGALARAHELGIVHRDLKPDNIFLCETENGVVPKLLDFGIAKMLDGSGAKTKTGAMIGTPWYMSPEQIASDKGLGPAADVWSFSVLLYEALAGERPFTAQTVHAAIAAIMHSDPRPLEELAPHVPVAIRELIHSGLIREPSTRPTMRELEGALKQELLLLGMSVSSSSPGVAEHAPARLSGSESVGSSGGPNAARTQPLDPDLPSAPELEEGDRTATEKPTSKSWARGASEGAPVEPSRSSGSRRRALFIVLGVLGGVVSALLLVLLGSASEGEEALGSGPSVDVEQVEQTAPTSPPLDASVLEAEPDMEVANEAASAAEDEAALEAHSETVIDPQSGSESETESESGAESEPEQHRSGHSHHRRHRRDAPADTGGIFVVR